MTKFTFIFIVFTGVTNFANAASPVWRISNGENHVFVAGTLNYFDVYEPYPIQIETAFINSDVIIFDMDFDEATDPDYISLAQKALLYRKGDGTLRSLLNPSTKAIFEDFLESAGSNPMSFNATKPALMASYIYSWDYEKLGYYSSVELLKYFHTRAKKENKNILYLESAKERLDYLVNMDEGPVNEILSYAIDYAREFPGISKRLLESWSSGNIPYLEKYIISNYISNYWAAYKYEVLDANKIWIPKIEKLLTSSETEFVMTNLVFLIGNEGMLKRLEYSGYQVEQQ